MGRAVTPVIRTKGSGALAQAGEGDAPLEQLAKYFPIETSGPYLALSTLIVQSTSAHTAGRTTWLCVTFAVLWFATLVLLMRQYQSAIYGARWMPILVGMAAFAVWAYSAGGLADELNIYNRVAAVVLPTLFAVVASLYKPIKAGSGADSNADAPAPTPTVPAPAAPVAPVAPVGVTVPATPATHAQPEGGVGGATASDRAGGA